MLVIEPPTPATVRFWLKEGCRVIAARSALEQLSTASAADLRELVEILAAEVEALGDVRPNNRPTDAERAAADPRFLALMARRMHAALCLKGLLICRDVVDGRSVGPRSLSLLLVSLGLNVDGMEGLAWEDRAERLAADPAMAAELTQLLRPYAAAKLKKYRAGNAPRRGFPGICRRKVAEEWSVSGLSADYLERYLKNVTVKTAE